MGRRLDGRSPWSRAGRGRPESRSRPPTSIGPQHPGRVEPHGAAGRSQAGGHGRQESTHRDAERDQDDAPSQHPPEDVTLLQAQDRIRTQVSGSSPLQLEIGPVTWRTHSTV